MDDSQDDSGCACPAHPPVENFYRDGWNAECVSGHGPVQGALRCSVIAGKGGGIKRTVLGFQQEVENQPDQYSLNL